MRIGRRPVFFAVVAIACLALLPPTPEEFRWVALVVGITYTVLALLSLLDSWSRRRTRSVSERSR